MCDNICVYLDTLIVLVSSRNIFIILDVVEMSLVKKTKYDTVVNVYSQ